LQKPDSPAPHRPSTVYECVKSSYLGASPHRTTA
jgi:hypothetical protein